jgi:hypothetical protein
MKPKLLSDVLRQASPRKFPSNRYNVLREPSPADSVRSTLSFRSRSESVKRKNPGDFAPQQSVNMSYATATTDISSQCGNQDLDIDDVNVRIAKVKLICEKVTTKIGTGKIDPALVPILTLLNDAVSGVCENQAKIVHNLCGNTVHSHVNPEITITGTEKRPRNDGNGSNMVDLRVFSQRPAITRQVNKPEQDPQVKKFKEVVREAEKSTLIFNLNMGTVPIVNQDTMSTKVTKALSDRAAQVDGMNRSIPCEDTTLSLDDVLSVVKGMKFYGKSTKTYRNPRDHLSGSYCTIPVRYDFNDKETRTHAETVFREKCKVQCSTPYPLILRESIKQVVEQTKQKYPDHFVKVNVDTNSMQLLIVRRPLLAKGDTSKKVWTTDTPIPIPKECLDTKATKIPDGFKVSLHSADVMDTSFSSSDTDDEDRLDSAQSSNSQATAIPSNGKKSPPKSK